MCANPVAAKAIPETNHHAWNNARLAPTPDWPCDPESGRMICSPDRPRPPNAPGRWGHPWATCTHSGEWSDSYHCEPCGHKWSEEVGA